MKKEQNFFLQKERTYEDGYNDAIAKVAEIYDLWEELEDWFIEEPKQ